ncbi:fimbria/pilus outer membrane usher protein [Acinetobacter larvae]|uniref:fimbria/pilus outer membrane usher protein n=1 Tax=Acinetobacter larvae TaxID=1789224 RepID=UPI001E4373EC|nr:fimbria/pilus outer membrane usher protein [Acinetobacter larvae]
MQTIFADNHVSAIENDLEKTQALNIQDTPLYSFDSRALFGGASQDIDLNQFNRSDFIAAGEYSVIAAVNDKSIGRQWVKFQHAEDSQQVELCIDPALLKQLDLKEHIQNNLAQQDCLSIKALSPDAFYDFDQSVLSLHLSLPLSILKQRPKGYINPARFDQGVSSAYLSYDFNHYNYKHDDQKKTDSNYLSLNGGINFLGFNYRHAGNFDSSGTDLSHYHSYLNVLSTDITPLNARLMLGDFNTQTYKIDSASIRGIQVATDMSMRPMSQRSYAPLIQGVANTNALVSVFQNGRKVYERTVPAGQFEINDLTALGNNGDLTVQVTENGGEKHSFIVPLQTNMNLVRVGQLNFSAASGQYKINRKTTNDYIGQFSFEYGLSNYISLYGGLNASQPFKSYLFGVGSNTFLGGINLDAEYADAGLLDQKYLGEKYQVSYQYNYAPSNTNISISGGYQTKDFMSLANVMSLRNYDELTEAEVDYLFQTYRLKNTFNASIYQSFNNADWGSLSLSLSRNSYWNTQKEYKQYSFGYSNRIGKLNYSVGFSKIFNYLDRVPSENRVYLSLSLPLDWSNSRRPMNLNSNIQHTDSSGHPTSAMIGVSGTLGENQQANYSLTSNNSWNNNAGHNAVVSASLGYNLPQAQLGSVLSVGENYHQYSLSARGALVAHRYGITAANYINDTYTIIHAKNAKGAAVNNAWGGKVDRFGNAIYSSLSPYEVNEITIDSKNLPVDVNLKVNQSEVVPRRYSATLVHFETEKTSNILFNVHTPSQQQIPIGLQVRQQDDAVIGTFGQSNQLFIENAALLQERLAVQWGAQQRTTCWIDIPKNVLSNQKTSSKKFQIIDVECKQ